MVVENLFNRPGIGFLTVASLYNLDYGVFWSVLLLVVVVYVVIALPASLVASFHNQRTGARAATPPSVANGRAVRGAGLGRGTRRVLASVFLCMAGVFMVGLVFVAVSAPLLTRYDPTRIDPLQISAPPSPTHLLGTDQLGRDALTRTLYTARAALGIGVLAVAGAGVFGTALGCCSA
jgi:ABC-type dipeptide/oligopeptide/nickel transport system permease subunit